MSVVIADRLQQQEKLSALDFAIAHVQHQDKQILIDNLLDKINDTKQSLQEAYDSAVGLPDSIAELAWFTDVADEQLDKIADQLNKAEKLSHNMVKLYAEGSRVFVKLHLDRSTLRAYKEVADRLKEVVVDVRHRFFDLPQDDEFMDLMQQLSEIA